MSATCQRSRGAATGGLEDRISTPSPRCLPSGLGHHVACLGPGEGKGRSRTESASVRAHNRHWEMDLGSPSAGLICPCFRLSRPGKSPCLTLGELLPANGGAKGSKRDGWMESWKPRRARLQQESALRSGALMRELQQIRARILRAQSLCSKCGQLDRSGTRSMSFLCQRDGRIIRRTRPVPGTDQR
jgi:hypothetical protein